MWSSKHTSESSLVKKVGHRGSVLAMDRFNAGPEKIEGALQKKSSRGVWQTRYFQLNNFYFNYFDDVKRTKLCASIDLHNCEDIELEGRFGDFVLRLSDGSSYALKAKDMDEATKWISQIEYRLVLVKRAEDEGVSVDVLCKSGSMSESSFSMSGSRTGGNGEKLPSMVLAHEAKRLTGYMSKKGGNVKNWKRRFFVLDEKEKVLNYYTEEDGKLKGSINLTGASVSPLQIKDKFHCLAIATLTGGGEEDDKEEFKKPMSLSFDAARKAMTSNLHLSLKGPKFLSSDKKPTPIISEDSSSNASVDSVDEEYPLRRSPSHNRHESTESVSSISSTMSSSAGGGRKYELQCDSAREMDEWIKSLIGCGCIAGENTEEERDIVLGSVNGLLASSLGLEEKKGISNKIPEEVNKVEVLKEEVLNIKYETPLLRRTAMGKQSATLKRSAEVFKLWSNCFCRVEDAVLYVYRGQEKGSALTLALQIESVDWIRYTDPSDPSITSFDISSGVDILRFKGNTKDESDKFIEVIKSVMANLKKVQKVRTQEDLKARAEAMIPPWVKNFDEKTEGDRVEYITDILNAFFQNFNYDTVTRDSMLKVITAVENISNDLVDIAAYCKKKSFLDNKDRLDVLEMYFKLYHNRVVMEITCFTQSSSAGSKAAESLGTDSILNLILCISNYHKILDSIVTGTHLSGERYQVHALDTEINELIKLYTFKVNSSVKELAKSIGNRIKDPILWTDEVNDLITKNEEGFIITLNVADLITIVNTHMKFAKDSELLKLPVCVLNECISVLETYQKDLTSLLKSKDNMTGFGITYLCALANDAANLMEEVDTLLEANQEAADTLNITLKSTSAFIAGGDTAIDGLVDIVMADLKALCAGCYKNASTIDEIHATIVDYLSDFQGFLHQYFFKKLMVKLVEEIVVCIISDIYTDYTKIGMFHKWAMSNSDVENFEKVGEGIEAALQEFEAPTTSHYNKQIKPRIHVLADCTGFLQISSEMIVLEFVSILDRHPMNAQYLKSALKLLEMCLSIRIEYSKEDKESTIAICKRHTNTRLANAKEGNVDLSPAAQIYYKVFDRPPPTLPPVVTSSTTSSEGTLSPSSSAFLEKAKSLWNFYASPSTSPVSSPVSSPTTSTKPTTAPILKNTSKTNDEAEDSTPKSKPERVRMSVFLGSSGSAAGIKTSSPLLAPAPSRGMAMLTEEEAEEAMNEEIPVIRGPRKSTAQMSSSRRTSCAIVNTKKTTGFQ